MPEPTSRLNAALSDRYRIVRELGEGGMATVYLAQDDRHDRQVALKVLKPELAAVLGAERFVQEIKTTANLHHPHILPLYDSGEAGGFLYYVMPYIDGETLRDRLDRETQLGVEEAVRIASEVADALDYAHRQGVIHRDIKPENILMHDGRPMVADFGIALAVSAAGGGRMTETGLSLGTPHYMSPEQATAEKELSGRSDIYSLGSVLYEMLTGDPPHTGSSAQQIVMKILTDPARPVTELRRSVPRNVAAAVAKSLEKLPADRFETARAFADALADRSFRHDTEGSSRVRRGARGTVGWKAATVALALVAGVLLALQLGLVGGTVDGSSVPRPPVRSASILLPESAPLALVGAGPLGVGLKSFDLSPDGSLMVFAAQEGATVRLHVRDMTSGAVTPLAGTEDAYAPFFSPDGDWVGYFAGPTAFKVPVTGGAPLPIAEVELPYGGAWLPDGRIVLAVREGTILVSVPAAGGRPDTVRATRRRSRLVFPEVIPGGGGVLLSSPENLVARLDLPSGQTWILTRRGWVDEAELESGGVESADIIRGTHPRAVEGNGLLFNSPVGSIMNLPLVPANGEREMPEPLPVLDGVRMETVWGAGQWDVSGDGALLYVEGENALRTRLTWRNPRGESEALSAFGRMNWGEMDLSPSGRRLLIHACSIQGECAHQVLNLDEGLARTVSSDDLPYEWGGWYDEDRLFVGPEGDAQTGYSLLVRADNLASRDSIPGFSILDVSRDGLVLAADGELSLVMGPRSSFPNQARTLDVEAGLGWGFTMRPGGEWIAYTAQQQEDGEWQVYLVRTAPPWDRFRVSPGGGEEPVWHPDGSLVYREGNRWMAVTPPSGDGPPGIPRVLFEGPYVNVLGRSHDVDPGGRHLLVEAPGSVLATRMTWVSGWVWGLPDGQRR